MTLFGYCYGGFVVECTGESRLGRTLGRTAAHGNFTWQGESVSLSELETIYENRLEKVFPCQGGDRCRKDSRFLLRKGLFRRTHYPRGPAHGADSRVPRHQLRIRFRQGGGSRGREGRNSGDEQPHQRRRGPFRGKFCGRR